MSAILTADLHLTDNPRDADRWNLLVWLKKQIKKTGASHLIICGDLTDAKDKHSAELVNRITDQIIELSLFAVVIILIGNHDFIDEKSPFFAFLGKFHNKNIKFIRQITSMKIPDLGRCLFLPCTRDYEKEWDGHDFHGYEYIFTHQSYDGCISENGTRLDGIPPSVFAGIHGKVYSGDIHVPQTVSKNIEYIGSPYRIKFGDTFTPRLLLLRSGKLEQLYFPSKARELLVAHSIEGVKEKSFDIGSQVKIRYRLRRRDYPEWPKIKREIKAIAQRKGWELCGLELKTIQVRSHVKEDAKGSAPTQIQPRAILQEFTERKKCSQSLRKVGLTLLEEVNK